MIFDSIDSDRMRCLENIESTHPNCTPTSSNNWYSTTNGVEGERHNLHKSALLNINGSKEESYVVLQSRVVVAGVHQTPGQVVLGTAWVPAVGADGHTQVAVDNKKKLYLLRLLSRKLSNLLIEVLSLWGYINF